MDRQSTSALNTRIDRWLVSSNGRRRRVESERGLEAGSIRLSYDDEIESRIGRSIHSALREVHVIDRGKPVCGIAIARYDHGRATGALEEELIDVFTLFF